MSNTAGFWGRAFQGAIKWGIRLAIAITLVLSLFALVAWQFEKRERAKSELLRRQTEKDRERLARPITWTPLTVSPLGNVRCQVVTRCHPPKFDFPWPIRVDLQFAATGPGSASL